MVALSSTSTVGYNQGQVLSHDDAPTKDRPIHLALCCRICWLIPQGHDALMLELITDVAHDDVHSLGLEQMHLDNTDVSVPTYFLAVVSVSTFVEHSDMHEDSDIVNLVFAREVISSLAQHTVSQEVVHKELAGLSSVNHTIAASPPPVNNQIPIKNTTANLVQVHDEFGHMHNKVNAEKNLKNFPLEGFAHTVTPSAIENGSNVSHEDGLEKHIHLNIQHDMELWQ